MHTLFAVDTYASIKPNELKNLLSLRFPEVESDAYKVIPLDWERLYYDRENQERVLKSAWREGHYLARYYDLKLCVIVAGVAVKYKNTPGKFDYVVVVHKDGTYMSKLLNPPTSKPNTYWMTNPGDVPLMLDEAVEFAGEHLRALA